MRLLIKNGRVIDPETGFDAVADILIENGIIKEIKSNIKIDKNIETIDATNKIVSPGFIDLHCHLRVPGREDEETIATGTKAAVAGGFTTICCMPNTNPAVDNKSVLNLIQSISQKEALCNVLPIACITLNREGNTLTEIGELVSAGAVALSDDGSSVLNSEVMRRAMEYSTMFDIPIIEHCEDINLTGEGVMNESLTSTKLGLMGITPAAELVIVTRDLILSELTGARIHFTHCSLQKAVELIYQYKKSGLHITCDVTPHHLVLSDKELMTYDTNFKMNPPLRDIKDVKYFQKILDDGDKIDCIATDHAPHTDVEKDLDFVNAPFGIIGLQTAFSMLYTELVKPKKTDIKTLLKKLTINPARILNIDKGRLQTGKQADITIIDPEVEWIYTKENNYSKSYNSPILGKNLTSRIVYTIINGKCI